MYSTVTQLMALCLFLMDYCAVTGTFNLDETVGPNVLSNAVYVKLTEIMRMKVLKRNCL